MFLPSCTHACRDEERFAASPCRRWPRSRAAAPRLHSRALHPDGCACRLPRHELGEGLHACRSPHAQVVVLQHLAGESAAARTARPTRSSAAAISSVSCRPLLGSGETASSNFIMVWSASNPILVDLASPRARIADRSSALQKPAKLLPLPPRSCVARARRCFAMVSPDEPERARTRSAAPREGA